MDSKALALPESLIGLIYDTALNPELWTELLESIAIHISLLDKNLSEKQLPTLLAHLEKSLTISNRLDLADTQQAIQQQVFDQIPVPCVLLSGTGEVQQINQRANRLLKEQAPIYIKGNRLKITDYKLQLRLNQCIETMVDPKNESSESTLVIKEKFQPHPMNLMFSRLIDPNNLKANVLVFIAEAGNNSDISKEQLKIFAANYKLTPSESELIALLIKENNLSQVAELRQVSVHTIRSQLKSVFLKTDTHRQVELIKLVFNQSLLPMKGSKEHTATYLKTEAFHRSYTLKNGHQIGYSDVGPKNGFPLVMIHPSTGSRLQQHPQIHLLYDKGIRMITPERPGFGLSTPVPLSTMTDFSQNVEALIDDLEIENFFLAGFCGGAAFTLALNQHMKDRIIHTLLISPTTPFNPIKLLHGVLGSNNLMTSVALKSPNLLYHLAAFLIRNVRIEPERYFDQIFPHLCESDAVALSEPEVTELFLCAFKEAVRQGPDTFANEIKMLAKPWPIDLKETHGSVTIWHGEQDVHVSIYDIQLMAKQIPNCKLKKLSGYGHFMIYHLWKDILEQIKAHHKAKVLH